MEDPLPDPLERNPMFRGVVVGSSALGMGALLASLTVVRHGEAGLEFHWSWLAVAAFVAGAALAAGFWRLVFHWSAARDHAANRRKVMLASGLLLVLAVAAFLYPLRFVAAERRNDVLIGLAVAVLVLSVVGFLIRTIVRWLEEDSEQNEPPE